MIKKLFYLTLLLVLLEGIIRKWFFSSSIILVLKYIPIFIMSFILVYNRNTIKFYKKDYPYYKILFLFIVFIILNVFTSFFGPVVWLIGLVAYIGFLALTFITPLVFKSFIDVDKLVDYILITSVPIFVLGFIQFFLPPTHFLNTYAKEMETIATAGIFTRVTGIFNYIGVYTTYLTFVIPLIFSRMVYAKTKQSLLLLGLFLLGLFNLFATGSRGPVILVLLSLSLILVWILFKAQSGTKTRFFIISTFVAIGLVALTFFNIIEFTSFDSLMARTEQIREGEIRDRLIDLFTTPFAYAEISGVGGFGIGSAHQTSNAFGYDLNNFFNVPYEESLERFVLELGIFGTILFLLLIFSIFIDLIRKISLIKNKQMNLLAFSIYTTLIQYFIFLNNIPYNWMGGLHFYLGVGLIVTIVKLDKKERILV